MSRVGLKVMARKDLVSLVAMGRVEMPYRKIARESRLTSGYNSVWEAIWKQESGRKLPKSSQENMGSRRGAESLGIGYLECRWWNEALCLLK